MRRMAIILTVAFVICSIGIVSPHAADLGKYVHLNRLDFAVAFAPPHNEPIVGDKVARYKLEGNGGLLIGPVTFDVNAELWGLNQWDSPNAVGHGFPDAWRNSRWGVETARLDWTMTLGYYLTKKTQAYIEHNRWDYVGGAIPSSHISEYYWMVGLRYIYK